MLVRMYRIFPRLSANGLDADQDSLSISRCTKINLPTYSRKYLLTNQQKVAEAFFKSKGISQNWNYPLWVLNVVSGHVSDVRFTCQYPNFKSMMLYFFSHGDPVCKKLLTSSAR